MKVTKVEVIRSEPIPLPEPWRGGTQQTFTAPFRGDAVLSISRR
jgi:hypothetical protein